VLGSSLARTVGLSFGSYLGRQLALGACRDDANDDALRRPFRPVVPLANLPSAVDLRPWMTPVEDQGALGSCTANALVGAVEYLSAREDGTRIDLSRLFVYFHQRLWDGWVREDIGASVSDGVRVLATVGVPTERSWPYQRSLFAVQPPEPLYGEAARYRIADWWSVPVEVDAMRACLAGGFPIVFGTRVTESFMRAPPSGLIAMPGANDRDDARHGRHALLIVGYDDRSRLFVVRNSWGQDWGDLGYCYLPYAYGAHREWSRNAWALRRAQGAHDPAAPPPVDLRALPSAAPAAAERHGAGVVGQVAGAGAELAVSVLTGSPLLGGLAGGLLAGVTPGAAQALRGRDGGAYVGVDRKDAILAALRSVPGASGPERLPWDDGLDERAGRDAIAPTRAVLAEPPERAGARPPTSPTPRSAPQRAARAPRDTAGAAMAAGIAAAVASAPSNSPVAAPSVVLPAAEGARSLTSASLLAAAEAAYAAAGGRSGPLGPLTASPDAMVEGAECGVALRCASGGVFVWAQQGAPEPPILLYGSEPLFVRWLELGAARSPLGWPCRPIEAAPDGVTRVLDCTRGVLVRHPRRPVAMVAGVLYAAWRAHGGPGGALGLPLADASVEGPAHVQPFERGALRWSPEQGARLA
jgi:hypothetical protein